MNKKEYGRHPPPPVGELPCQLSVLHRREEALRLHYRHTTLPSLLPLRWECTQAHRKAFFNIAHLTLQRLFTGGHRKYGKKAGPGAAWENSKPCEDYFLHTDHTLHSMDSHNTLTCESHPTPWTESAGMSGLMSILPLPFPPHKIHSCSEYPYFCFPRYEWMQSRRHWRPLWGFKG